MFKRIVKRDGKIVKFDPDKITEAIAKAGLATEEFKYDRAKALTEKVLKRADETKKKLKETFHDLNSTVGVLNKILTDPSLTCSFHT